MKMIIEKEIGLDYGHTLPKHFSFCNQVHGHHSRVITTIEGEIITEKNNSSQGMVLDFIFLKEIMMNNIHAVLDHGFAVWKEDIFTADFIKVRNKKYIITEEPPTAEYLAKWAYYQIKKYLPKNIKLLQVKWYETETSSAVYFENETDKT